MRPVGASELLTNKRQGGRETTVARRGIWIVDLGWQTDVLRYAAQM